MKVLFLDVDRVLNHIGTYGEVRATFDPAKQSPWEAVYVLDPECVRRIRRVLLLTGARVVLSSVWRLDPHAIGILRKHKVLTPANEHPRLCTPHLGGLRGHDVAYWLDHNPVERYAIADDDGDFLDAQYPYFVHVKGDRGLQDHHAEQLISILNR